MKANSKVATIPAFPNHFPWNELLLRGWLDAKSRNWKWSHTGLTLLYTSKSTIVKTACDAYVMDPDDYSETMGALVGIGYLLPVRKNTTREKQILEKQFLNGQPGLSKIRAGTYRFEFSELHRFEKPIKFTFPRGAVLVCNVPITLVERELKRLNISFDY